MTARAPKTAPSDAVRAEWGRRVHAEYRSAALTQHLTLWLIQLAVSPDLIDMGLRIVKDELIHARMSHEVLIRAGGAGLSPLLHTTLALPHDPQEALENRVTRATVEVFCLGETLAVPLFKELREGTTVPVARRALDRVLRDEARHRDFGWTLLDWLLEQPYAHAVRTLVNRELGAMLTRLRRSYAGSGGPRKSTIPDEDRQWGLMAPALYGTILDRALTRDYAPRFGKRGFDALGAWGAAKNP